MRVFCAKGSSLPVLEAAKVYREKYSRPVRVSVCDERCTRGECTPTAEKHGFVEEVSREAFDLAVAGSEADLDDLEVAGLVAPGMRASLGLRAAAILVPERNEAAIRSLADLCKPDVRIAISTIDCLRGVWEDVAGRAGLIAPISRNITVRVAGCMAIVDAIANARVDAAFGWSSFTHFHPRISVVPLDSEVRVMRATSAAVVATSAAKDEARAFLEFLAGSDARALFWKYGWVNEEGA